MPNFVYANVVDELRTLQADQVHARKPFASVNALLSLHHLKGTKVGATRAARGLWAVSALKVRELLWRDELMSVGGIVDYRTMFDDAETLQFGYVDRQNSNTIGPADRGAWAIINAPALTESGEIPDALVVKAIWSNRNLVPLKIAHELLNHSDAESRGTLSARMSQLVNGIDEEIRSSLHKIVQAEAGMHAGSWGAMPSAEKSFMRWLQTKGMRSGSVYGVYGDYDFSLK